MASSTRLPVIRGSGSLRSATRLQEAKELRDDLAHAYPPAAWKDLHEGVRILLAELDRYVDRCADWLSEESILEMGTKQ